MEKRAHPVIASPAQPGVAIQARVEEYHSMTGTHKTPAVYIMASQRNGTLYVGVTSGLLRRVWQHRTGELPGFSNRYECKLLVYFELHESMSAAIHREKQIKSGSRAHKLALIEKQNPTWRDLYNEIH